ncbi:MAG TPA: CPBP family glutamic-type intramembrane protease [Thermoplasmata archaeon]|nr:CPBP family glutamic-type intramembrane protease [Thermoplasmata archaeon]
MECARCGTPFEGPACPTCGAPALTGTPGSSAPWACPRCGAVYAGTACPRCGLPAHYAYPVPPRPNGGRALLTVVWTISIVAFLVLASLSLAGLLLAPGLIVPGINGVRSGGTVNGDFTIDDDRWTFTGTAAGATGGHRTAAGNGYLEMSAPTAAGTEMIGFWWQAFDVAGAMPFIAIVDLDVQVDLGDNATRGTLGVYVQDTASVPVGAPIGSVEFTAASAWTRTPRFLADDEIGSPGRYYVLLAFTTSAPAAGSPTTVGLDNVRLAWATDAGVVLYLALPTPALLFRSQDPGLFLAYYGFLVAAIVAAAVYHGARERRAALAAFTAPIESIGARLRSRSGWIAVAQVFLAMNFFQIAVILVLGALGSLPESPFEVTAANVWTYLFDLASASVYEEIAFRVVLIGVPMALGSLVLRVIEVNRTGGTWRGGTTPGRHIAGSVRYLLGGTVRRTSSKETLLAAWAFLLASSTVFGLAHLPGWGWWKVAPGLIAGLGFGYLFLRHGVGAAVLAHFVNDYAFSLVWLGYGGIALEAFLSLFFIGLSAVGSGFFAWYALVAWGHLRDLVARFGGRPVRRAPTALGSMASPPLAVPGPTGPPLPSPPVTGWAPPPVQTARGPVGRPPNGLPSGYVPTYRPPPYGFPPVRFQCPACGWVEARYDAGRFTCGRCGKTF